MVDTNTNTQSTNTQKDITKNEYNLDKIFTFPNIVNITAVVFSVISLMFNRIDIALILLVSGLAMNTVLEYRYHYEFLQFKEEQFKKELYMSVNEVLIDIQKKLKEMEEILKQKPVIKRTNRHKMYELATELVQKAENRLLIVQRTPSLYFKSKTPGNITENNFIEALEDVISRAEKGKMEVIYAFSIYDERFKEELVERAKEQFSKKIEEKIEKNVEDIQREVETIKQEVLDSISKMITEIIEEGFNRSIALERLHIISLEPDNHPQPLIISDNTIAVWITDIETEKLYIKTFDYDGSSRIFEFYKNIAENFIPARATKYLKHEILPYVIDEIDRYSKKILIDTSSKNEK